MDYSGPPDPYRVFNVISSGSICALLAFTILLSLFVTGTSDATDPLACILEYADGSVIRTLERPILAQASEIAVPILAARVCKDVSLTRK